MRANRLGRVALALGQRLALGYSVGQPPPSTGAALHFVGCALRTVVVQMVRNAHPSVPGMGKY